MKLQSSLGLIMCDAAQSERQNWHYKTATAAQVLQMVREAVCIASSSLSLLLCQGCSMLLSSAVQHVSYEVI